MIFSGLATERTRLTISFTKDSSIPISDSFPVREIWIEPAGYNLPHNPSLANP
jgi:hypothetical protein